MKAIKSKLLKEIIDLPENKDKFRRFLATRSATSGQFVTTKGTNTNVKFVVEKTEAKANQ